MYPVITLIASIVGLFFGYLITRSAYTKKWLNAVLITTGFFLVLTALVLLTGGYYVP